MRKKKIIFLLRSINSSQTRATIQKFREKKEQQEILSKFKAGNPNGIKRGLKNNSGILEEHESPNQKGV